MLFFFPFNYVILHHKDNVPLIIPPSLKLPFLPRGEERNSPCITFNLSYGTSVAMHGGKRYKRFPGLGHW